MPTYVTAPVVPTAPLVAPRPLVTPSLVTRPLVTRPLVTAPLAVQQSRQAFVQSPPKPTLRKVKRTVILLPRRPRRARWDGFAMYHVENAYEFEAGRTLWEVGDCLDFDEVATVAASTEGCERESAWCEGVQVAGEHAHPIQTCRIPEGRRPDYALDEEVVYEQPWTDAGTAEHIWESAVLPLMLECRAQVLDDPERLLRRQTAGFETLRMAGYEIPDGALDWSYFDQRVRSSWASDPSLRAAAADLAVTRYVAQLAQDYDEFAQLSRVLDMAENEDLILRWPGMMQVGLVDPGETRDGLMLGPWTCTEVEYASAFDQPDAPSWMVGWRWVYWTLDVPTQ